MFNTNVNGLINMTQEILPIFKKRSDGGRGDIINIGSIAGREAYPGGSIYCATKAAVRTFTDALRKELIASRIRIINIDPGQVETVSILLPIQWIWSLLSGHQEFSVVRFYGDKAKADAVYAYETNSTITCLCYSWQGIIGTASHLPPTTLPKSLCFPLADERMSWLPIHWSSRVTR